MEARRTRNEEGVLEDLLRLLIKRWGYLTVSRRLDALEDCNSSPEPFRVGDKGEPKRHRLSAREYVEKINLPSRKREILLELATRYENRQFLPTIGHVKDFLERKNEDVNAVRGRSEAVPKILKILTGLSDENLETMLQDDNYSGPSRLGPISDAIKARGEATRSNR